MWSGRARALRGRTWMGISCRGPGVYGSFDLSICLPREAARRVLVNNDRSARMNETWASDTHPRATATAPATSWRPSGATVDGADVMGRVRIARQVLRTVVREAALAVPGVSRLAATANTWAHLLGRPRPKEGVGLTVRGTVISVDLYLVVEPGVNMVTVGEAVQESAGAAIEHILGMEVSEINVYIRDVA